MRVPDALRGWAALVVSLAGIAILGALDYTTGFELSFALFYLVPIGFAGWFVGRSAGMVASVASAVTWHVANRLAGEVFSSPAIPYWNTLTRLGFFIAVTLLLSRLHQLLRAERARANTDFLTGVLSSRAFHEAVEIEVERSRRHGGRFTLMYIDADNFKSVNDEHGHLVGDSLLKLAARTMSSNVRVVDRVGRLGGDEFALLLPEADAAAADRVADKLRGVLLETMRQNRWPVTFSIGMLTCEVSPASIDELIRMTDDLMYAAKREGKNAITRSVYSG